MQNRSATTAIPYTEYPVAYGNFDTSRAPIDRIALHTEVGFKTGTEGTFNNPQSHVSAHYGINQDGSVDHFLEEFYTAYHAGEISFNRRSIGIEHEDFGKPNSERPDALYEKSSLLVADICKYWGIPCDSNHIFRHQNVPGSSTACPDSLDTNRIISRAAQILSGATPPSGIDKRPYWFDLINKAVWNKPWEKLTQAEIDIFVRDYQGQYIRSGRFDELGIKAGLSGNSNNWTSEQIYNAIVANSPHADLTLFKNMAKEAIDNIK